jgi:hypothetical protein
LKKLIVIRKKEKERERDREGEKEEFVKMQGRE